ncbi:MAG: hypothetical protein U0R79_10705 [Propionicimonas sp.]
MSRRRGEVKSGAGVLVAADVVWEVSSMPATAAATARVATQLSQRLRQLRR